MLNPEPAVYHNGVPLPIGRSDALDLLLVLAEDGGDDYDRASLSTLLFEDGASSEKLRLAIFHLRKAIGAAYIPQETQKEAKRLRFDRTHVQLDTDEFARRATRILQDTPHAHTGSQFIHDVTETLALYRSHFLKDYHFVTRAMTAWKEAHQRRLAQLREQLMGEVVRFLIQQGALPDAQQYAEQWLTTGLATDVVPLQHLIWIAVSRQRVVEAQQHLAMLQKLEDEGRMSWGPSVAAWRAWILEKAEVPLSVLDISVTKATPYTFVQLTDFIERPALSVQFADLLLNPERLDIIGLTGLPGAGKTSFAQHVLETVRRKNPRKRIAWADLNNESDLEVLLNDVVSQFGMKQLLPLDYTTKQRRFRQMMKAQQGVIVIDEGVSQKFAAPEFLDSIVALFEGTQLVLIGRELPETRFFLFHVPGLDQADMRAFLSKHLSAEDMAGFADADAAWFDRLAAITGGLPLALALVTGAVMGKRYSLPTLIRDMPVTQAAWTLPNTIARYDAILDWSWRSLSADEKTLLYAMTMFDPSGCLLADVNAILTMGCRIPGQRVTELVTRLAGIRLLSLREPRNAVQRATLHPIVYRYIEAAPERGETRIPVDALRNAYASYIFAYVESNLHDDACLDLYRHEIIGMFMVSLSDSAPAATRQAAVRLFRHVYSYFDRRGLYATAQRLLDMSLAVTDESSPERVHLLSNAGQSAFKRGAFDEAYRWLTEAKSLADQRSDDSARPLILRDLGRIAFMRGRPADALALFDEGLASAQREQEVIAAQIMANMGMINSEQGRTAEARAWFERITSTWGAQQPHALSSEIQDVLQYVSTQLGNTAILEMDYAAADHHLQQALMQARNANNPERMARSYLNLGALRYSQRDFDGAWNYFTQGNVVAEHIQHGELLLWFMVNKGALKAIGGEYKTAGRLLRQALMKANDLGVQTIMPLLLMWLGLLHLFQTQFERARLYLLQALRQPQLPTAFAARALYALALSLRYEQDILLDDSPETAREQIREGFDACSLTMLPLPPLSRNDLYMAEQYLQIAFVELPELSRFHILDAVMDWLQHERVTT